MIPIVIVSYNNHRYVANTVKQLCAVNPSYADSITIMDNCSTDKNTIAYLKSSGMSVIYNETNGGPWISPTNNRHVYDRLPDKFVLTDPDLEFNPNLPCNFIEILSTLSDEYSTSNIGLALDITSPEKFIPGEYANGRTIHEHELIFWKERIPNNDYELYKAPIDTTFCLINKRFTEHNSRHIRVAGNFTAMHLPWYKRNSIYTIKENYDSCLKQTRMSTTSTLFLRYLNEEYTRMTKREATFFIENRKSDQNLKFWRENYSNWEPEVHDVMDQFLREDKVFIDIGGWIGTTCIYGSMLARHVYVVEADPLSFQDMAHNCGLNSRNITCINRAITNIDDSSVWFGKNRVRDGSVLNDSTSQVYDDEAEGCVQVKTITLKGILDMYSIDPKEISLVKVDIEGGEECILDSLYELHSTYRVPVFVSFHLGWWKDPNLDRFSFLTPEHKSYIKTNPFGNILFN